MKNFFRVEDEKTYLISLLEEEYGVSTTKIVLSHILNSGLYDDVERYYVGEYRYDLTESSIIMQSIKYLNAEYKSVKEAIAMKEIDPLYILIIEMGIKIFESGRNPSYLINIFRKVQSGSLILPSRKNIETYLRMAKLYIMKDLLNIPSKKIGRELGISGVTVRKNASEKISPGLEEYRKRINEFREDVMAMQERNYSMCYEKCPGNSNYFIVYDSYGIAMENRKAMMRRLYRANEKTIRKILKELDDYKEELKDIGKKERERKVQRKKLKLLKPYKIDKEEYDRIMARRKTFYIRHKKN